MKRNIRGTEKHAVSLTFKVCHYPTCLKILHFWDPARAQSRRDKLHKKSYSCEIIRPVLFTSENGISYNFWAFSPKKFGMFWCLYIMSDRIH